MTRTSLLTILTDYADGCLDNDSSVQEVSTRRGESVLFIPAGFPGYETRPVPIAALYVSSPDIRHLYCTISPLDEMVVSRGRRNGIHAGTCHSAVTYAG